MSVAKMSPYEGLKKFKLVFSDDGNRKPGFRNDSEVVQNGRTSCAMEAMKVFRASLIKICRGSSKVVEKKYMGIDKDPRGAMHATGNIIRDAWVFGLIPETQTCEGWTGTMVDALYDKVTLEWEKYGLLVSNLPPELRERHQRIYDQAVAEAKEKGWDPELDDDEV